MEGELFGCNGLPQGIFGSNVTKHEVSKLHLDLIFVTTKSKLFNILT